MGRLLVTRPLILGFHTHKIIVRSKKIADFKQRVEAEIKESKDKQTERLVAHTKKRSDEKIARRSTILNFWGQAQVRRTE